MSTLNVRRTGYALGAEITGVDASKPLDANVVATLRKAWLDHMVICLPGQDLTPAQFIAFAAHFGELDDMRRTPQNRHPEHETMAVMSNKPVQLAGKPAGGLPYGREWHTDRQFTDHPATASLLNAKELPDVGGDTMFANVAIAYDALSPKLKEIVERLEAVHDIAFSGAFQKRSPEARAQQRALNPLVVHPAVRTHPETGLKSLFVGEYVRQFFGMTEEESAPLLHFLNEHATRYEFTYRHRWKLHDLVMWDNRSTLHRAIADFDESQMRRMSRCALVGPKSGRLLEDPVPARPAVAV